MTVNIVLLVAMGVLYACGVYMVLERNLTRILLGIVLMTNATILLLLVAGGPPGEAPLYVPGRPGQEYNDPLPQALMLTAIVIGFAVTAFLVAMIYRSWQLSREDEVEVDAEDLKVASQDLYDAEEDSELEEETSEFLDEDRDPNAEYEHTSPEQPEAATATAVRRGAGTGWAARRAGRRAGSRTPHSDGDRS